MNAGSSNWITSTPVAAIALASSFRISANAHASFSRLR
jgi:hypothetical protein